ncbi:MAG: hypothetical protein KJ043_12875 [Anaerolineae bacterium]|nr:hypothetical protein [Anaerolineae bacterium]
MNLIRIFGLISVMLLIVGVSVAQESDACPMIPVEEIPIVCEATSRNEACFVHPNITINNQDSDAINTVGQIIPVNDIQTMTLDGGMALLRLQADMPADEPTQNLQMLAWGHINITNNVTVPSLSGTTTTNARVRSVPFAESDTTVIGVIPANVAVSIIGRNDANTWYYIQLGDYSALGYSEGWTSNQVLRVSGDTTTLPVIDYENPPAPSIPMSDITLRVADDLTDCTGMMRGGLFIQTLPDTPSATLVVNGASITLGSTALLTIEDKQMDVYLLDGKGVVQVGDDTTLLIGGANTSVPLDDELIADGAPTEASANDLEDDMPMVNTFLAFWAGQNNQPQPITVAQPPAPAQIQQTIITTFAPNGIYEGRYSIAYNLQCTFTEAGRSPSSYPESFTRVIRIINNQLVFAPGTSFEERASSTGDNQYQYEYTWSVDEGQTEDNRILQRTTTVVQTYRIISPREIGFTLNSTSRYPVYVAGSQFATGAFATTTCTGSGTFRWVSP